MADPSTPKYLAAIVIGTGVNDEIEADDSTTGGFTATIAAGEYFISGDGSATDLLQAIEDALNDSGADTWALTLSSGVVSIECDAAWSVDWTDAGTTFDGAILGYDTSAASSGDAAESVAADYQHQYGWYGAHPTATDSGLYDGTSGWVLADVVYTHPPGGAPDPVLAGSTSTERIITHLGEPAHKAHPDTSYTNQSWQDFWAKARDGRRVRYYYNAAGSTYYDCMLTGAALSLAAPARYSPRLNIHNFTVHLASYQ